MRKIAILCMLTTTTVAGPIGAQSAADKATAQALFDAGKNLLADGKYAESCAKFAESQRLDPAPGTLLNLADCYEKSGLTASAWATWLEAAAAARQAGQTERERAARDRATALKSRLVSITVVVPEAHRIANLAVRRDGTLVGIATWGTAVPVDPGTHSVMATAPGHRNWQTTVTVVDGVQPVHVTVPKLELEVPPVPPNYPPNTVPASSGQPAIVSQPAATPPPNFSAPPPVGVPTLQRAGSIATEPQEVESEGATQRTWAYVAGGVGIAGIAVGSFYGLRANSKNEDSIALCSTETLCGQAGYDLRQDALDAATYSTIAFGVGSAALVTGVVLLLTAPSVESATRQPQSAWAVRAGMATSSGHISIGRVF